MNALFLLEITPSLNTPSTLFLLASSFGLFLAFLLLSERTTRKFNLPIILILIGFSLILIQYVLGWTSYRSLYPQIYFFVPSWYLAFGPLFLSYLMSFHDKSTKVDLLHYLPAVALFVIHGYYYLKTGGVIDDPAVQDEIGYRILWQFRSPWVVAVSLFSYLVMARSFVQSKGALSGRTETLKVRDSWTRILLYFFGLFLFAYVSYFALMMFDFFNPSWDYAISASMTLGIYGIGIAVYKIPQIFNGEIWATLFSPQPKTPLSQTNQRLGEYHDRLLALMETEKMYLKSDLRLTDLADDLGTTIHIMSKVINDMEGMNFNQFVNNYRLLEAEELLLSNRAESIKSIYFEVGFNNKTSFYRAFRIKHHCTPSEYQKKSRELSEKGLVL